MEQDLEKLLTASNTMVEFAKVLATRKAKNEVLKWAEEHRQVLKDAGLLESLLTLLA